MSSQFYKTTYEVEGPYASVEEKTMYVHHCNTVGVVVFYDEDGNVIFSKSDFTSNNEWAAINRLMSPETDGKLSTLVEFMEGHEINKIIKR